MFKICIHDFFLFVECVFWHAFNIYRRMTRKEERKEEYCSLMNNLFFCVFPTQCVEGVHYKRTHYSKTIFHTNFWTMVTHFTRCRTPCMSDTKDAQGAGIVGVEKNQKEKSYKLNKWHWFQIHRFFTFKDRHWTSNIKFSP